MAKLNKRKRRKVRIRRQNRNRYKKYAKKYVSIAATIGFKEEINTSEILKFKPNNEINSDITMGIKISKIRVFGFRGLENIEVELEDTTVLTGVNNTGKTSLLKALQISLGNRQFISQDDFHISGSTAYKNIIVDILVLPAQNKSTHERSNIFAEDWEILFNVDRIKTDSNGQSFIPLRTIISFDELINNYKTKQYILKEWPDFKQPDGKYWYKFDNGNEKSFHFDEVPFFYLEAQRDIIEDMKTRSSYLGKMISQIEYSPDDIKTIEDQIKDLNEKAVESSDILTNIKRTLLELETAMGSSSEGVEITPFTKRLRDLNKGLTIYYSDRKESFSMEYHGMGTRSWSSLLTLKALISLLWANAEKEGKPFFPIIAVEEPEAHLHPNAQKKLYTQISTIPGQKIIATHSPYIAASAELKQIRSFYKDDDSVICGKINISDFNPEELRKIERQVINTRGEIFFSRVLVLFEGETEEQALPIFATSHFGKTPIEMGIDFIGVGGQGNYLPFLRVAEALNIPWYILSDGEPKIKESVKSQFLKSKSVRKEENAIIFLEDGYNFETQLIKDGYVEEIRNAMKQIEILKCNNEDHKRAKEIEINKLSADDIIKKVITSKTTYGPEIAEAIVISGKSLPPRVIRLFKEIDRSIK